MAVPERSGRHDVAAEGTAKRREDGPAAAETLRPAPKPQKPKNPKKAAILINGSLYGFGF